MKKFDYSFLKNDLSAQIFRLATIIYDIKGKESERVKDNPSLFNKLKKKAIRDSIKGSNAIENIYTTEKRIDAIANGDNTHKTHEESEIIGYRNVLNKIHTYANIIKFDKKEVLGLHKQLLDVAKINNRGKFKTEVNVIVGYKNNKPYPVFVPVPPKDVDKAMDNLFAAYSVAIKDPLINPLLLIPCLILDFLCIHPFDDGNGRVSRLLTLLLLYKSDFDIGKYISIENMINEYKNEYYEALSNSSKNWDTNKNDYEPFIIYMIQIIYKCYMKLDEDILDMIDKKLNKSDRIETVLLNSIVPISKREISDKFPDISNKLIENVLSKLLKEKKIIKIGNFKNATYYRK